MKLTDEQIKLAVNAFFTEGKIGVAGNLDMGLRAAAPHLQLPWEMPTPEECRAIECDYLTASSGDGSRVIYFTPIIANFIARRNAILLVDPLRDAIETAFMQLRDKGLESRYHRAVDEAKKLVIAALDGVQR